MERISETSVSTVKAILCQKDYNLKNTRRKNIKKLNKFYDLTTFFVAHNI